jgi:hypothetical protein
MFQLPWVVFNEYVVSYVMMVRQALVKHAEQITAAWLDGNMTHGFEGSDGGTKVFQFQTNESEMNNDHTRELFCNKRMLLSRPGGL